MELINQAKQINTQSIHIRASSEYQALKETEAMIRKDCIRTFNSLLFFKSMVVQDMVVRLLLVFALSHPTIGYKQGMTDILAILILCLFCERWRSNSQSDGRN